MQLTFWAWVFGLLAILFNPIIPVYLQRQSWQIFDYVAIVVIFLATLEGRRFAAFRFRDYVSKNILS